MECLLEVLSHRPLRVHASLYQPERAASPQWVPRLLGPLGAFFTIEVTDADHDSLYTSMPVKLKLKLDPRSRDSYLPLEPGYTFGTVLTVPTGELRLRPGRYRLSVNYDNGSFTGPSDAAIGRLGAHAEMPLVIE